MPYDPDPGLTEYNRLCDQEMLRQLDCRADRWNARLKLTAQQREQVKPKVASKETG